MPKFYVEYDYGCGIREYPSLEKCIECERLEHGWRNFKNARMATKEDIDHVKAMGGWVGDDEW